MSCDTETWEEEGFKEGDGASPEEGVTEAGASERVAVRGLDKMPGVAWRELAAQSPWETEEEKEPGVHKARFWR